MAADLISAIAAKLRATPSVVSAIGENVSIPHGTKIWLDFAEGRPAPPWITIIEVGESITYDSSDSYAKGDIQISVFATGKKQSRDIGRLVTSALVDSLLVFDDGYTMEIRDSAHMAQVEHAIAPGSPTIYHYIITFTCLTGKAFSPSLS